MFCVSPLLHPEELISCCHCSSTFFPVVVSAFAVVCSLNLCVLPFSPTLSCQHCSSAQLPHGSCLPSHPAPGFAALLYPLDFMGLVHCSSLAFEEGDFTLLSQRFQPEGKNFLPICPVTSPRAARGTEIGNAVGSSYP